MKRCKIYQTQRYKNVVKVVRVVRFSKSLGWIRLSGCQTLTTKEKIVVMVEKKRRKQSWASDAEGCERSEQYRNARNAHEV